MKPAEIIGTETFLVDVPVKKKEDYSDGTFPFSVSYGTLLGLKRVFLKLDARTETGAIVSGWGEASPLFFYSNETPLGVYCVLNDYGDYFLKGKLIDVNEPATAKNSIDQILIGINPYCAAQRANFVQTAIDYALYDLAGRLTDTPVYKILNPHADDSIVAQPCWSISCDERNFQREIAGAEGYAKRGYGLKLKVGHNLEDSIQATIAFLSHYGPEQYPGIKLRVDPNSGMSVQAYHDFEAAVTAKVSAERISAVDFYVEEPIDTRQASSRLEGLKIFADLVRDSRWRIMADETIYTLEDVQELIKLSGAGANKLLFNVKVQRLGGLNIAMTVAELAKQHQIPVMIGGMFSSSLGKVADCHYALAIQEFMSSDGLHPSLDYVPAAAAVVSNIEELEIVREGKRILSVFSGRPGWGAEINEELIRAQAFQIAIPNYYPDFVTGGREP